MARGMFNINDPDAGPVKVTIGETSLPGEVDYGTIPSDLIRDEIAQTQLFRDFISKFGDKLANKGAEAAAWLEILVKYGSGEATLRDVQSVDVSGLMDIDGFEDYYKDITVVEAPQNWEDVKKILRKNGYSESEIASVEGGLHKTKQYSDWLEYPENRGKEFGGIKYCHEREQRGGNTPYDDDCQNRGSVNLGFILGELGYENGSWWDVRPTAGTACTTDKGTPGYKNSDGDCIEDPTKAPGAPCVNGPHGSQGVLDKDGNCTFVVGNSCRLPGETGMFPSGVIDSKGDCVPSGQGTSGGDCTVITQENADECGYEITSDGQLVPKDLSRDPDSYPTYVNCGGGIFAETEVDCPDMEGTGGYSEEQKNIGKAIKDWIEGQIGQVKDMTVEDVLETVFGRNDWDPLCEDESDIWNCAGTDGTEGNKCWKDCVSASVLGGIPGLPMPPGNIDVGTVRDLEDKVKEIGGTISDIFSAPQGDADDEGFIQRAKDWILGKIEDIFGGIDDATPGQITDWITGVLGTTISGIILQEIEGKKNDVIDKINEITGLPLDTPTTLINCADYGRAGGEVESLEECDGCLDKTEDIGTDGRCRKFIKDDFDVSDVETTCKREGKEYNDLLDECGDCIREGYVPGADGVCAPIDGDVDEEGDPRCLNKAFAERNPRICGGQITFTEGTTFGDGTADDDIKGTDVDEEGDPRCSDKAFAERNPSICGGQITFTEGTTFGDGGDEIDDECKVIDSSNYFKCGYLDCFNDGTPGPFVKESEGFKACPSGDGGGDGGGGGNTFNFTVNCDQKEPYAPTGNVIAYNAAYKSYEDDFNQQCLSIGPTGGGDGGGDDDDECAVIDSSNYFKCDYLDCFTDGTPGPFVKRGPKGYGACDDIGGDGGGDTTTKVKCPEGMYNPADGSSYADSEDDCKLRTDVVITGTDGGTTVTEDDKCDDPFAVNSGEIGECGECISGYSRKPGQTKCSKDKVIEDPEGTGGPTYTCNDPNATTNSDGSCGPCKVGYTFNSDLELCAPNPYDPCIDAEYARDNPTQCGTVDPECNDCTCAEYAADNPEECGTGGGGTGGGGGGGGGGAAGGSGMFDLESFEITGDPQLLAKMEFPITDFLSGMFKDYV